MVHYTARKINRDRLWHNGRHLGGGGIMVPVDLMPRHMQAATAVSPLARGSAAFQDTRVREGTLRTPAGFLRSRRQ